MDDTSARFLTTAVEKQTKVLEGLAELIAKAAQPVFAVNPVVRVDGNIRPDETTTGSLRELMLKDMLEQANGIIRSFSAVCDRKGESTNWDALSMQVRKILADQHKFMLPELYASGPRAG
jgi:hypothetical protein